MGGPRLQNIDASKLVLKIDTEGAERDIIQQLAPFIAQYKPSMLLSFVSRVPVVQHACRSKA